MSERSQDRPSIPPDQLTRDITLPPLPDRPPPAVPPEWASYVPQGGATTGGTGPAAAPSGPAPEFDGPTVQGSGRSTPHRDPTRPFGAPEGLVLRAPADPDTTAAPAPRRRWTGRLLWTLVLLTLAVIIACGVYLVLTVVQR